MKILVMGTGAIGGCYGGMLVRAGCDVTFVARGANLDAIRSGGLRVESVAAGSFTLSVSATDDPSSVGEADLILYCVKSYHNEAAIDEMAGAVGDDTAILTLQNGLESGEMLTRRFGSERVLLGAAYIEAARKAPGLFAEMDGHCGIVFGEQDGSRSGRALEIQETFERAGIDAELSADVRVSLWTKLARICAFSGMACITRASFADVLDTPATNELTRRVMTEAADVGRAMGVRLPSDLVDSGMAMLEESKDTLSSSMYLDLQAGSPMEVGALNGAVSRYGRETGVATPLNDFIAACLSLADRSARAGRAGATTGGGADVVLS